MPKRRRQKPIKQTIWSAARDGRVQEIVAFVGQGADVNEEDNLGVFIYFFILNNGLLFNMLYYKEDAKLSRF